MDRWEGLDEGERAIVSYESGEVVAGGAAMRIDWYALGGRGAYLPHFHWDSLGVYDFSDYDSLVEKLSFNNPKSYRLSQNYPNPFNASTKIEYTIANTNFFS